ncbi:LysM peptidoglycan-binding domain-containing protein [Alkaliphilus pronyensis]|uniref:LysM peptidoglycan-binding domain-containing protein n=1 Tax=Alkaliphilus pronyensis TaxID=1482732 RepID=A0A6I0F566_9FIRM|nr:LysM peptidoglycan-binding domain-containing protein [Alkaliphilus pronyensis]KAB3531041.1 LysM peptidoglycan-binding domain-containing protein [Alkaliphilus pronyensis]
MHRIKHFFAFLIITAFVITPLNSNALMVHRVQQGETMFEIAKDYGVTLQELKGSNRFLKSPEVIYNKQLLIIPIDDLYVVKPGDTLYKISKALGIPMEALAKENNLLDINRLYVGQKLQVPEKTKDDYSNNGKEVYVVKKGDTLFKIAQAEGVTVDAIAKANGISNINMIYLGQELIIPKKKAPAPVKKQPEKDFQYSVNQLRKMYPDTIYLKGSGNERRIALTFDDGPNVTYTNQVLDTLKKYDVPATFFIMGSRAERFPNIVNRVVSEGHTIGNHTWNHPDLRKSSNEAITDQIETTEDILFEITGLRTTLMRPPYGAISANVVENLKAKEYKIINWSVDSVDWRDKNVDQIIINTLKDVSNNDIVLFHDASGDGVSMQTTVDSLPELIETLKLNGYTFVTVDELLNINPYK